MSRTFSVPIQLSMFEDKGDVKPGLLLLLDPKYFQALSQVLHLYKLVSILGFLSEVLPTSELQTRHYQLPQAGLEEPHQILLGLLPNTPKNVITI